MKQLLEKVPQGGVSFVLRHRLYPHRRIVPTARRPTHIRILGQVRRSLLFMEPGVNLVVRWV